MSQGCNPVMCQNDSETQKELRSIIAGLVEYIGHGAVTVVPNYEAVVHINPTHSGAVELKVR